LGRAGFEKALALEEKSFWTGGYLLEGLIDREGSSRDTISINAELVPPANGKRINVDVSGPRRNLPEIAEQLARRILSELQTDKSNPKWDQDAEAERFEQESAWAMRWQMWPETYAAAESAWELGRHTEAVATARLKGLLGQTAPDSAFNYDAPRTTHIANTQRQYDPVRDVAWTSNPPQPTDVAHAIEAASVYAGISSLPDCTWKTNTSWVSLGTNVLSSASAVIAHQYLYNWRSNRYHQDLPLLREAVRGLASALPKQEIAALSLRMGGYWQETPAATAQVCRQNIESGEADPRLLFSRTPYEPFWVGWTRADREYGVRQWDAFISGLQRSTNRMVRAQAALLRLYKARLDPDIARAQEEFLDAVLDDTRARFSPEVSVLVLDAFDLVWSNRCTNPLTLRRERLHSAWRAYDPARGKNNPRKEINARLQIAPPRATTPTRAPTPPSASGTPVFRITRHLAPMFTDRRGELLPARADRWVVHDGQVITVGFHPMARAMWPPPADGPHVIEIDMSTGRSRMLPQVLKHEPDLAIKFQVIGNEVFWIAGENQLGILQRRSAGSRLCKVDMPLLQSELIALGSRLFIVSGDYLAEFSTADQSVKLLASKRRKPAATQLDSWSGWTALPRLWVHSTGALLAHVGGTNVWAYNPSSGDWMEWRYSQDRAGAPSTLSYDSGFARCLDERVWIDGTREVLLSTDRSRLPRWPIPLDFPLTPGVSMGRSAHRYSDGTNLWLLMQPMTTVSRSNTTSVVRLTDRDLTLLWFDPKWEIPRTIPLQFAIQEGQAKPLLGFACTNTAAGLVFYPSDRWGTGAQFALWLLPWADLNKWLAEHQPDSRNLPRREPERRRRFDADADGILSPDELKTMDADKAWNDQEDELSTRRMLFTFDANRDDALDLSELTQLCNVEYPDSLRLGRPAGTTTSPARFAFSARARQAEPLLEKFDTNHSKTIAGLELRELHRHLSEQTSTGAPVAAFRPHVDPHATPTTNVPSRKFDLNGNGKLEPAERHALLPVRLRAFDVNTNGTMDPDETREYLKQLRTK